MSQDWSDVQLVCQALLALHKFMFKGHTQPAAYLRGQQRCRELIFSECVPKPSGQLPKVHCLVRAVCKPTIAVNAVQQELLQSDVVPLSNSRLAEQRKYMPIQHCACKH